MGLDMGESRLSSIEREFLRAISLVRQPMMKEVMVNVVGGTMYDHTCL
jgi:hypothetical protein